MFNFYVFWTHKGCFFVKKKKYKWQDSTVGIVTCRGWAALSSNSSGEVRFCAPVHTGPEAHPSPVQWVSGVVQGGKAVMAWP